MKIFIDMDGVLALWLKSVCKTFNKDYNEVVKNWPEGVFETSQVLGISKSQMWKEIDKDFHWWANIEPAPYKDELIKLCLKYDKDAHILSAPHHNPLCLYGKGLWVKKHTKFGKNVIFTSHKYLCAGPDRILIDDNEKKINSWVEYGGIGILFPGLGNKNQSWVGQEMEYVKLHLEDIFS